MVVCTVLLLLLLCFVVELLLLYVKVEVVGGVVDALKVVVVVEAVRLLFTLLIALWKLLSLRSKQLSSLVLAQLLKQMPYLAFGLYSLLILFK